MAKRPVSLEKTLQCFQEEIGDLFGTHRVALLLYGSAATDEFQPERSDINILVVLDEEGIRDLTKVHPKMKGWIKRRIRPLFLTESYLQTSLDSYPLEFFTMRLAYRILWGKDVLAPLEIPQESLRLQCEREIKGKLLLLRQGYLYTLGRKSAMQRLITESIGSLTVIFRGILHLVGEAQPATRNDVIRDVCSRFGLDLNLFARLLDIRAGRLKPDRVTLRTYLVCTIQEIVRLSQAIDAIEQKGRS